MRVSRTRRLGFVGLCMLAAALCVRGEAQTLDLPVPAPAPKVPEGPKTPAGVEPGAPPAPPAMPSASRPQALSLTVSGGVSLGSYEAGVLYFLTEAVKRSEGAFELKIASGASAGSANALITLIDSCRPIVTDPTQSLGFQTWLPVGIAQLFDPKKVTAISVLNRAPLVRAMEYVAHRMREGLRADCDVVLGVSVTRKVPAQVPIMDRDGHTALEVPRAGEKFVVRIQGRGPNRLPRLTNYVDPRATLPQPLLPFADGEDETSYANNVKHLLDLLYASAAFPLAFAPYRLAHCETDPVGAGSPAHPARFDCHEPVHTLFIDGGVFDNSPLRLTYRIVQRGLRRDAEGRLRWLAPDTLDGSDPPPVRFSYVDPATGAFPPLDTEVKDDEPAGAIDLAMELASSFVLTSRRRELLAMLEENRDGISLGAAMGLTQNQLPTISGQLGAFFGFFERDFRELDFYLGMYDGFVSVRRYLASLQPDVDPMVRLAEQFPVLAHPMRSDIPRGLRRFACLLSQVEQQFADHQSACKGEELRNFRILLQVTIDRLHAACMRSKPADLSPYASPLCHAAAHKQPRVVVPGVKLIPDALCAREEDEPDFNYSLRLLAEYGFAYKDLGLDADDAQYGMIKIRRKLLSMSNALAGAQPSALSQALIETAGRAGANTIEYEPPKDWIYATGGTALEVGASLLPFSWNESWARLNIAIQVSRWQSIATPSRFALSFTPLIGPELELLFLSGPALQTMFGVRAGYQASVRDAVGFEECGPDESLGDARNCSQFVLQTYLAGAVIERLRLQLVGEFFPTIQTSRFASRVALQLSFGLQFF